MEAHAVHYNQKYSDFICAQNKPDGLAVVAFFIQATDIEDNPCFDKLATAVKDIIKINSKTKVVPGNRICTHTHIKSVHQYNSPTIFQYPGILYDGILNY